MDEPLEGGDSGAIRFGSVRQSFASEHQEQWTLVDAGALPICRDFARRSPVSGVHRSVCFVVCQC
jgi:hypothetical protein